jgi:hypothetical protein
MVCLFIMPSPARTPKRSQPFSQPSRTMRITTQAAAAQKSWSRAFMVWMLCISIQSGAVITPSAAIPRAKRRPPRSRAIRPVISTRAAPERAGSRRMAKSESPKAARISAVTAGKRGGMSTNPQARCSLQARK